MLPGITGEERSRCPGQFRSYNRHEEKKNRLVLSVVCAAELEFVEGEEPESSRTNQNFLEGYICKMPVCRKTPLGREIADLLVAVNRPYGKSDYIPCICWGRNARYASGFEVGAHIQLWGPDPEPGVYEKNQRGGDRAADRLRGVREQDLSLLSNFRYKTCHRQLPSDAMQRRERLVMS